MNLKNLPVSEAGCEPFRVRVASQILRAGNRECTPGSTDDISETKTWSVS